jgi:hypothetical protein
MASVVKAENTVNVRFFIDDSKKGRFDDFLPWRLDIPDRCDEAAMGGAQTARIGGRTVVPTDCHRYDDPQRGQKPDFTQRCISKLF